METLQEFLRLTKETEYLMCVLFLFGFIFFWRFLNKDLSRTDRRRE